MKKRLTIIALLTLCLGCAPEQWVKNQHMGRALGTTYAITFIADRQLDYQKDIDSVFAVVNKSMSTYISTSDISRINNGDTTLVVDDMFKEVFLLSKEVHQKTKGYFDPTVGVLVDAWGFGPGEQKEMDSITVDSLLQFVGWEKVQLKPDNTVSKKYSGIRFDFNAIAKGYAIDRLGKMLDQRGIANYLIEVGGEILAKGINVISDNPWSVGIDDPQVENGRRLKKIIALKDKAMASSGNYRKFRIDPNTGKKYVHTIDPNTGYTKNSNVLATSVIADDCATADAFATAFMAMELQESKEVLKEQTDLEAYIIYLDEKGETQEFMTSGFEALVLE